MCSLYVKLGSQLECNKNQTWFQTLRSVSFHIQYHGPDGRDSCLTWSSIIKFWKWHQPGVGRRKILKYTRTRQWFSAQPVLHTHPLQRYMSKYIFDCHKLGWVGKLLAYNGQRAGMLLNILEYTRQPLTTKNYLAPNTEFEKPQLRRKV